MGGQLIEGKGVSRTTAFRVPPEMLIIIGVDTAHKSLAEHPRFDKRVLNVHANIGPDDPGVLNIKEIGVQVAVKVEVEEIDGKDCYVVVDGRGRVLRNRIANKLLIKEGLPPKTVPVDAYRKTESSTRLGTTLGIVLNEQRDEDTPMNRVEKAQYLLSTGYDVPTVAAMFRVSDQTINEWTKVINLAPVVRKAIDNGLSVSAAAKLHGLSGDEQKSAVETLMADGGKGTVKQANSVAKSKKNGGTDPATTAPTKRELRRAIENGKDILSEEMILAFRIALGDVTPGKVKGLVALLRGDKAADAAE